MGCVPSQCIYCYPGHTELDANQSTFCLTLSRNPTYRYTTEDEHLEIVQENEYDQLHYGSHVVPKDPFIIDTNIPIDNKRYKKDIQQLENKYSVRFGTRQGKNKIYTKLCEECFMDRFEFEYGYQFEWDNISQRVFLDGEEFTLTIYHRKKGYYHS